MSRLTGIGVLGAAVFGAALAAAGCGSSPPPFPGGGMAVVPSPSPSAMNGRYDRRVRGPLLAARVDARCLEPIRLLLTDLLGPPLE
jgi:hypothetical protein